ncbi:MAG: SusC/RagA family TonB-linked outer membrane protein [Bacteroidota bacterium]
MRITEKCRFLIIILLAVFPAIVVGQSNTGQVSGRVTDSSGEPLPGVTIVIEGTNVGTTSGMEGEYTLDIPENTDNPVLVFSYIGFTTQRLEIDAQEVINVVMTDDVKVLDEFVVVGYGIQRKVDLTGAVSSIDTEGMRLLPVAGVDQALQGRAAGVNITHNTGMPGEGVNVRIRGVGSINSSNDPLYIVDGVPTTDALSTLSTTDIESISILKDAASTAIYGARANNGIILITTRKGKKGEPRIEFSSQVGFQQHGRLTPMANRDQYIEMYNQAATNDNAFIENPRLQRELIDDEVSAGLPDLNQLESIFRRGIIQNHSISVSGGTDLLTYMVSGNVFEQEGIILGSHYDRYSGRITLNSTVNDFIRLGTNINMARSNNDIIGSSGDGFGGNGGSVVRYAFFRTPAIPIKDENGQYVDLPEHPNFFGDGYNPVALADKMNDNISENRIFGDINTQIQILPSLIFTGTYGLDRTDFFQRRFNENWGTNNRINNPNSLNISNGYYQSLTASNVFSWNTTVAGTHNISALLGTEAIGNNGYTDSSTERDFPDQEDYLIFLGNGLGSIVVSESRWANSLLSLFGRVNYSFDDKYLLSSTLRRDGSSRFSADNRWGTFYSISGAWRMDRESFLENNNFVDMLKLRVGYGAIGNQGVGNYAWSDQISPNYNYPFGGVMNTGYAISLLGNVDLQWETSTQFDVGIDFSIMEGRFYLVLDYYRKVTDNMLVKEPIPPSSGYASPAWVNNGEILNEGIEAELTWQDQIGDVRFELTGNVGYLHNEVLSLSGPIVGGRIDNGVYATRTEVGFPIGSFFLYEMDGIFQNSLDVITSAYQGVNIQPGDVRYVDQNSDGVINELDRVHAGSAIPKMSSGMQLALNYNNFDASLFFQGATGHSIYYQVATDIEGFYRPFNITMRYYDEHWTGEGTSNTQPRASWSGKANNTRPSTRFLEDGSFIRLKNLQVGYRLPENLSSKMRMKSMRIFFIAHNLMTFTKYPGLDPEMTTSDNAAGEGDIAAGIDWGTYPLARSFNLGVQIAF